MDTVFLQKIAIYGLLGLILDLSGQAYDTPLYWCTVVLVLVSNFLSRKEGFDEGIEISQDILATALDMLDQAKQLESDNDSK